MNIVSATITGSLILNGVNISSVTGSESSINALNSFTASAATTGSNQFNGNQTVTGSVDITGSLIVTGSIIGTVTTASYVLNAVSASYALVATTSSYALVATSASYATNSDLLDGRDSLTFANTGSNAFVGTQNINGAVAITGSLTTTGAITAQTLNVQQVTSSIVYSSGSNVFGNSISNTQSMTGSVGISGSLAVTGASTITGVLTLNSTITNGTYTYTLPSDTGTLALTSALSSYLPLSGGTLTGALSGTSATFSGNVGINTSTPDIIGYGTKTFGILGVGSDFPSLQIGIPGTSGSTTEVMGDINFFSKNATGAVVSRSVIRSGLDGATNSNSFSFFTMNAGTLAERMRITSGGNVGIGTTAPDGKLDVNGLSYFRDDLILYTTKKLYLDSGGDTYLSEVSANTIQIVTAGSERMRITSGGNVGIGTSSPNGPLDVAGPLYGGLYTLSLIDTAAVAADIGGGIYFGGNYTGTTKTGWAGILGRKDNATDGQYGGYMAFQTRTHGSSPAERMRITSDGNVGIGTTSPTGLLDVRSATNVNAVGRISGGSGTTLATLYLGNTTGNYGVFEFNNANDNVYIKNLTNDGNLIFQTTTAGSVLTTALTISITQAATFSSTLGINGTADNVKSGTYTPTASNTSNLTSISPQVCQYIRIGNVVNVSGVINIQPTSSAGLYFDITLPITSGNFTNYTQTGGSGVTNVVYNSYTINSSSGTTRVSFNGVSTYPASHSLYFSFQYLII